MRELSRRYCAPDGFPSHLSPAVPGTIHEGGELGYALATPFGAALDAPDRLVACVVGDGEAETGPTAAAWGPSARASPPSAYAADCTRTTRSVPWPSARSGPAYPYWSCPPARRSRSLQKHSR
ncbi:hypothetical protein AB0C90_37125 [Streptomyces sp. NPDC048550]|uniref:hypothetical protein n=1 Tax=Streptomyces sp. NPDC048550 TaxID=3155739 RepID=UPI0034333062